ncbi:Uncharacterised protein [Candidatus Anstonella stagnisolia]|nr:Uncharacterised protein [Candidatus Anstonella stagnisolia]
MENGIIFYSAHARALCGSTEGKIKAILAQGCIEYDKERKVFLCKPIMQPNGKPYNKTQYEMQRHKILGWSCSCQGWQSKHKKHLEDPIKYPSVGCSHVAALWEHIKRQHIVKRENNVTQALMTMFME